MNLRAIERVHDLHGAMLRSSEILKTFQRLGFKIEGIRLGFRIEAKVYGGGIAIFNRIWGSSDWVDDLSLQVGMYGGSTLELMVG